MFHQRISASFIQLCQYRGIIHCKNIFAVTLFRKLYHQNKIFWVELTSLTLFAFLKKALKFMIYFIFWKFQPVKLMVKIGKHYINTFKLNVYFLFAGISVRWMDNVFC